MLCYNSIWRFHTYLRDRQVELFRDILHLAVLQALREENDTLCRRQLHRVPEPALEEELCEGRHKVDNQVVVNHVSCVRLEPLIVMWPVHQASKKSGEQSEYP